MTACPEQTVAETLRQVSNWRGTPENAAGRLVFSGRQLPSSETLSACGVQNYSTVQIVYPLLGGGGDGGATGAESRSCYLEMYLSKKPEKVDPFESKLARWSQCRLSAEALEPPCVADRLGNVFNKEALVRALVARALPPALAHIRGLKDVLEVHLATRDASNDKGTACRFQCPITGLDFNGKFRFYALRTCGHVLSAKALKEVRTGACLVCHAPFGEEDKIVINGTDEEVAALRARLEAERAKAKAGKKDRKRGAEVLGGALPPLPQPDRVSAPSAVLVAAAEVRRVSGLAATGAAELSAAVAFGDSRTGSHGENAPTVAAQRPKGSDRVQEGKRARVHVPEGATKSVYSSLFTSSSKRKFQETYMCRSLPLARN